jgi:YjjI family glycine radical enzyme
MSGVEVQAGPSVVGDPHFQERVRSVVVDRTLTYRQRVHQLAGLAESALPYPALAPDAAAALASGLVDDLAEGPAPYRPRYVLVDVERFLSEGSRFLEMPPAHDLHDALTWLLVLYGQVPSITCYPVWLGDIDHALEPFAAGVPDDELRSALRRFWIALDRLLPDAFTHANLGPHDSRVARMLLQLDAELEQVVPNLTLKVDPAVTPPGLVDEAVRTIFATGKPHVVNHPLMVRDLGERYGVASCYNALPVGGGSHTLVRLNLLEAARRHDGDAESFVRTALPDAVELTAQVMEARIRFLVEDAGFYASSWLAHEGLISLDRFGAMFGVYGMAECVDELLARTGASGRYGHDADANALGYRISARLAELVLARPLPYCEGGGGYAFLHAQSGIDSDIGVTAGCRIPVGDEPPLIEHLRAVAPHHTWYPSGISDIVHLDDSALDNPAAVADLIRGGLAIGMRDVTCNLASNGFVRITGYLVKKRDLEQVPDGTRHGSDVLAAGAVANTHVLDRHVQRVGGAEVHVR